MEHAWTVTSIERTEMKVLRCILGVSPKDEIKNEVIIKTLGWHAFLKNARGQIEMVRHAMRRAVV